jgi:hypothetical protein
LFVLSEIRLIHELIDAQALIVKIAARSQPMPNHGTRAKGIKTKPALPSARYRTTEAGEVETQAILSKG